jgi:4-hydroxybenzoate polyprenyltransferase
MPRSRVRIALVALIVLIVLVVFQINEVAALMSPPSLFKNT